MDLEMYDLRTEAWETIRCIGIVGSRRRNSKKDKEVIVEKFFQLYEDENWIVSGGCPEGADRFAEEIAKEFGIPIVIFHANWGKYKKQAGFVRNIHIAHHSDELIACVAKDRKGGTEDTIKKFTKNYEKEHLHIV